MLEIIGGFISEIIVDIILGGIFTLFKKLWYFMLKTLFGYQPKLTALEKLEKKFLYKTIILKRNINNKLVKGQKGSIVELINEYTFLVEFRDNNNEPIKFDSKTIFKVRRSQVDVLTV